MGVCTCVWIKLFPDACDVVCFDLFIYLFFQNLNWCRFFGHRFHEDKTSA